MSQNEITEIRIYSIEDFVKSLHQYTSTIKSPIWFRGCTNIDYYLIPSLYRKINKLNSFQINDKERQVFSFFRERSIPYHNYSLTNSWHTYFLMQHNGIPTRLLDWTENAFVGLYFALMNPRNYIEEVENDAVVWVLMPEKWNQHALKDLSYKGGILRTDDQLLNAYTPDTEMGFQGEFPVALYTDRTNSRIVAQQGVFVVFGKEKKPMEVIYHENNFPDFSLAKIIIPRTEVVQMLDDLLMMGITESVIFPDLSGFSAEVIRRFKLR